jgi:hypothetical protein
MIIGGMVHGYSTNFSWQQLANKCRHFKQNAHYNCLDQSSSTKNANVFENAE